MLRKHGERQFWYAFLLSVSKFSIFFLSRLQDEREVVFYCDFHGHSRRKNIFIYGCENKIDKRLHTRVFPYMLSKNACDIVSESSCLELLTN